VQDSEAFCRNVLSAPEVVEFIDHNFVAWAGDIRSKDAFMVRPLPAPFFCTHTLAVSSPQRYGTPLIKLSLVSSMPPRHPIATAATATAADDVAAAAAVA
jgi:hypothetical protein